MSENENIIGSGQKLFFLFLLFLVLFSFPIMSIFNTSKLVMGIPVLFVYLFFIWIVLISLLYLILKDKKNKQPGDE
jgi:ABC-type transport system involved in multi-copper enzyme maturation permease subunit